MTASVIDWIADTVEARALGFACVAILVIAALAGALYGVKPAWSAHAELTTQRDLAYASAIEGGTAATHRIELLEKEIGDLRDRLYGNAAGISANEIESFVIDALARISEQAGVDLEGITPGKQDSIWMFDELPYEVRVEGSFFAIHRWLFDVEEALRPMVVKEFVITPNRDRSNVVIDLRVVAYRAVAEETT